ncbi:NYN domain-containing protein [Cellulomonas sp. H30R-01]|uniref:NYN domain-containing protein n=1 Tax=Cellulomonas sp. H30R-01 TaxID=2704467 RepID=UPI00138C75C2|nr:NYN domain-containing protein [Cellulomonas sp. H30R-01]QHT57354.1 NYN domain-containing protein [Cellulomonas sp. H30R-01]
MPETTTARVAVYVDFDNIVISRYDQTFRRGDWYRDSAREHRMDARADDPVAQRLAQARVDVGAILDYASSFGSVVVSRAYADWSVPANAAYQRQLVDRAVDLTQLFPVTAGLKNGADIRLAVDVVEDLFRLPDVTHVVVVAGDSDYVALAQRAKRLGRYVVGIGVAGATSRALMAACDEFADYDDLLETSAADEPEDDEPAEVTAADRPAAAAGRGSGRKARNGSEGGGAPAVDDGAPAGSAAAGAGAAADARAAADGSAVADGSAAADGTDDADAEAADRPPARTGKAAHRAATQLLMRAMRLVRTKKPDDEWVSFGELKNQMTRMDPAFSERSLGYRSFGDFVADRPSIVESGRSADNQPRVRLRPGY